MVSGTDSSGLSWNNGHKTSFISHLSLSYINGRVDVINSYDIQQDSMICCSNAPSCYTAVIPACTRQSTHVCVCYINWWQQVLPSL